MEAIKTDESNQVTKEQILGELKTCDFDSYVNALILAFGQSMAANDVFFIGELGDEAFYQSILKNMSESSFGAMNLMDIVRGLATGDSQVNPEHQYVTYTPSLDTQSFQSYKDLEDLKTCCDLEELAERLLEDRKYEVFLNGLKT